MKIFIAYRYRDSEKDEIRKNVEAISSVLEIASHAPFIFARDVQKWGEVNMTLAEIIKRAFEEIDSSDALLVFIDSDEKSEGAMMEVGYAHGKGKKIIACIKKGLRYSFVRGIAWKTVEFDDTDDLVSNLKGNL